ncbi:FecR family protein [Pedobacter aquatilis]|uniref:FecR family protein n=1 Tax=Pedobacter aquatilis TaxID=351343 RepID=UPI0025B51BC2|nr:FecR family protein [Pedobacter aquatilis]MDN3586721.1 FecR family protein [Pedobacter aquatilis]
MNSFPNRKDLEKIVERYLSGKANADEIQFIEEYYNFLGKTDESSDINPAEDIKNLEQLNFEAIKEKIAHNKKTRISPLYKYISAAAALVLIFTGIYYFQINKTSKLLATTQAQRKHLDILPGKNKAILTLADGSKVVLDENTSSDISDQDGIRISKEKDGQLVYTIVNNSLLNQHKNIAYNTISTPRGGQYQVILPDGSRVWLNAASSLKYPEAFTGKQRLVVLTGEAYFEVAKNKSMPFHVVSQNQNVEVLGTHFNINSYLDDNTVKTTLLEGSVKVSNLKFSKTLKPGEQAISGIGGEASIKIAADVDTDDETAWKNGLFQFNDSQLKVILSQLERWYDIKIDYSDVPAKRFNGMVPRKSKLSEVLKMLEKTGNIKFQLEEGRKLKVLTEK